MTEKVKVFELLKLLEHVPFYKQILNFIGSIFIKFDQMMQPVILMNFTDVHAESEPLVTDAGEG